MGLINNFVYTSFLMISFLTKNISVRQIRTISKNSLVGGFGGLNYGVEAKTLGQQGYFNALMDNNTPVVACVGSAGSGKTLLACDAFVKMYERGEYKRFIITRPSIPVEGENLGFLPGSINDKMSPWTKPIFDILENYYSVGKIKNMIENHVIEIVPLAFMRGRSFHSAFILADEMQNATPRQFQMLMTRLGIGSKMVITGDLQQSDLGFGNGLDDFCRRYDKKVLEGASLCFLQGNDVLRSAFAKNVVDWYN